MSERETNPVERLHNICDALSEQMEGSAFSREEWDRIDAENAELRREVEVLRKDAARYHWLRNRRRSNNRWPHITQYPWHESIDGPQQFLPVHDAAGYHPERLDAWIDAGISADAAGVQGIDDQTFPPQQ